VKEGGGTIARKKEEKVFQVKREDPWPMLRIHRPPTENSMPANKKRNVLVLGGGTKKGKNEKKDGPVCSRN